MAEIKPIYPVNPTPASSPYKRKLQRIREDMSFVLEVAPAAQKEDVSALIMSIDMLIAGL